MSSRPVAAVDGLTARLSSAGFIAAEEEAVELIEAAERDGADLEAMVCRRLQGEPLAWITGTTTFAGRRVRVDAGVYVPRWHSEIVAAAAAQRLPERGVALDLCTGSGAVAVALAAARPAARILATDADPAAVACARTNGVDARCGDLFDGVPGDCAGTVDVVVAVVPYVPSPELPLLQRDTFTFETTLAYDGGADGTRVLRRVIEGSPRFLRGGGALVLEVGGRQDELLAPVLTACGFAPAERLDDEEGDLRGIMATLG